jgi:hypothetical protein
MGSLHQIDGSFVKTIDVEMCIDQGGDPQEKLPEPFRG